MLYSIARRLGVAKALLAAHRFILRRRESLLVAATAILLIVAVPYLFGSFEKPGAVFVESPELYTRERLVNDRYRQDAWLERQLIKLENTEDISNGFFLSSNEIGLSATLGGAETDPERGNDNPPANANPESRKLPYDISYRSRFAIREVIRQAILENQLDDRHDLRGNSVYVLKFDTTIVPGDSFSRKAMVRVMVNSRSYPLLEAKTERFDQGSSDWVLPFERAFYRFDKVKQSQESKDKLAEKISEVSDIEILYKKWISNLEFRLNSFSNSYFSSFEQCRLDLDEYFILLRKINDETDTLSTPVADTGIFRDSEFVCNVLSREIYRDSDLRRKLKNAIAKISLSNVLAVPEDKISIDEHGRVLISSAYQHFSTDPIHDLMHVTLNYDDFLRNKFIQLTEKTENLYLTPECIPPDRFPKLIGRPLTDIIWGEEFGRRSMSPEEDNGAPSIKLTEWKAGESDKNRADRLTLKSIGYRINNQLVLSTFEVDRSLLNIIFKFDKFDSYVDPEDRNCEFYYHNLRSGLLMFARRLQTRDHYSYTVLPKGEDQAFLTDMTTLLSARMAADTGSAPAALDVLASSLTRMQAGASRSSVIGFSGSGIDDETRSLELQSRGRPLEFGWIISPPRGLNDEANPINRSMSALISVPAWQRHLDITVKSGWVSGGGWREPLEQESVSSFRVPLPVDLEAIDEAIMQKSLPQRPAISTALLDAHILRPCQPGSIVIPGARLWRSTRVTIGAQRADRIEVMPDMQGIIAHFDEILPLALEGGADAGPSHVPLRVWTSEGMDQVNKKVQIVARGEKMACRSDQVNALEPGGKI